MPVRTLVKAPGVDDMTLGEAVELLRLARSAGLACACIGPPLCCQITTYGPARALVRGAHIAVKQIAELAQ